MKGVGGILWVILVVGLIFMAQRMPPLVRVNDPDAVAEQTPEFFGFRFDRSSGPGSESESTGVSNEAVRVCPACHGEKHIPCPSCQGSGQIEKVTEKECPHCDGTGVYRSSVSSRSGVPCPFCRATGTMVTRQPSSCPRCGGEGTIPCPTCQGAGTIPQESF